ncbi:TRAP transporter substrate-binding protein [Mesorhizobium sp. 1B3]|uniref:TRAP transporter substrate-binding protein n=1 Tax=Mesorhizobium sp. 1B3 TaxID=3243599 RepID=UPI003D9779D9
MKLIATAVAAFFSMAAISGAAEVEWKLGSSVGPQDDGTLMLQKLADRVLEKSDGRFEIEVVPVETLGFKNVDSLRVLKQGVIEAMWLAPYYLTRDEPLMGVFAPHGMFVDPEDNLKVVDVQYEIGKEILAEKWEIVQIARAPFASLRDLIMMSKEPVNTIEGLKKLKVRQFTKEGLQAFNALGISTQMVPSSELYLALQTGVVDAAVYGPTYGKSQSIYEVTCCFSYLSAFSMAYPFSVAVSKNVWEGLPADLQKILAEESEALWQESVEGWKVSAAEKEAYEWLTTEGKMKKLDPFPEADRKAVQDELIKVWKSTCEQLGEKAVGYCNRIEAALAK